MRRLTSSVLDSIERGIENQGIALFQDARSLLHECRLLRQERDAAEGLLSDMAADGGFSAGEQAERARIKPLIAGCLEILRCYDGRMNAIHALKGLQASLSLPNDLPIQPLAVSRAESEFLRDTLAKALEALRQRWPTPDPNLSEALALREASVIHLIERALSEGKP